MSRSCRGGSVVELLIATLIMGFVASGIIGLAYLNWKTGQRIENKTDGVNAARQAIERISLDLRQARSVGDYYGAVLPPTSRIVDPISGGVSTDTTLVHSDAIDQAALEAGTASLSSPQFPAPGNPFYTASDVAVSGWTAPPYSLSAQTLIVQKPIFNADGFPKAYHPNGLPTVLECMDTYVYRLIADTRADHNGEYTLQVCGFPGTGSTMVNPRQVRTILTGITGPIGANQQPRVFQYLTGTSSAAQDNVNWTNVADISGVVVNLELARHDASNSQTQVGGQQSILALKQEIFLRNNALTTISAAPPP